MSLKAHFHFYSRQGKLISRAYFRPESAAYSAATNQSPTGGDPPRRATLYRQEKSPQPKSDGLSKNSFRNPLNIKRSLSSRTQCLLAANTAGAIPQLPLLTTTVLSRRRWLLLAGEGLTCSVLACYALNRAHE